MANERNKLKRKLFNAEEALKIIISEDYTFGTSSSDDSSSESSDYDETSDTNSQSPESPSPKSVKDNNFQENTFKNNTVDEHGEIHVPVRVADISDKHSRPTFNTPTLLPETSKKSDTASTLDPNISHDKSHENDSPHTCTQQTHSPSQATEEFVLSIPIHTEPQLIHNEESVFLHEQEVNPNPDENEFLPQYFTNIQNILSNFDDHGAYIIETENIQKPQRVEYPIANHSRDIPLQQDTDDGWIKIDNDQIPDQCQFTGNPGLNMNTTSRNPEDFFNNLFDERMYTILAEETNNYARQKIRKVMENRDPFQQMDHYSYKQHARLGTWKDLNSSDIKIFISHLLVMSSVRKPALHNYWSTTSFSRTPFFGQYLGRNKFQDILWNLHVVSDTSSNPQPGLPNHDPLAKVRPLINMCQDNFKITYKPGENIAIDESTMAYKGRVKFLQYSKSKPNRFHIKLFMVSESDTGYISGFSVYTGRASNELLANKSTLDPDCTVTTRTVMSLLDKCNLLDDHRTVYFDNWFNSPELLHELR